MMLVLHEQIGDPFCLAIFLLKSPLLGRSLVILLSLATCLFGYHVSMAIRAFGDLTRIVMTSLRSGLIGSLAWLVIIPVW